MYRSPATPLPGPEIAAGAVARGARFIAEDVVRELEISSEYLDAVARELEMEVVRRITRYGALHAPDLRGRTVILVDDASRPAPVASASGLERVRLADEVIAPFILRPDCRVGDAYEDFTQLSEQDVLGDPPWTPAHPVEAALPLDVTPE